MTRYRGVYRYGLCVKPNLIKALRRWEQWLWNAYE